MAAPRRQSAPSTSRRRRRDRSHSDSHASSASLKPIPQHPDVPRDDAPLITDAQDLAAVVDDLRQATRITFDTEFIGEETYYPNLCLVQVGTRERVYLVDPLAIDDLSALWEVIASPDRVTVVHAGRQDMQILTRHWGAAPQNVVDTQLIGGLAVLPWPCSLTKSVQSVIDAPMPPGMTFTAWDARPLSPNQLRYAADDVRYLPLLHDHLQQHLAQAGHEAWAEQACSVFEDPAWYEPDLNAQRRKIEGNRRFNKTQRRTLQRLVEQRDAIARAENLPPRSVMPDAVVLQVARDRPSKADTLAAMRGMPAHLAHKHADAFLAMLDDDGVDPPPTSLRPGDESPADRMAIDGLWHMFCGVAIARGIAPGLATSRSEVSQWYLSGRQGMPGRTPWQKDICQVVLGPLVSGSTTLELHWDEHRLRQVTQPMMDHTS